MGSRGSKSRFGGGGGGTSGGDLKNVMSVTSLISMREGKQREVDEVLNVLRDVESRYGIAANVEDVQVAKVKGAMLATMAYYDSNGNLAVTLGYFDAAKMDQIMSKTVRDFHPPRGKRTGMEAVVAHEMGHRITDVIGQKLGRGSWELDKTANDIIKKAAKAAGAKNRDSFRRSISGYASKNNAEAVAEAFADVYCNGNRARKASRAIVAEINKYF